MRSLRFAIPLVALVGCSHHDAKTTSNPDGSTSFTPDGSVGDLAVQTDPNAYNLGTNVPGLSYYAGYALYADVMLTASGNNGRWDAQNAAATVDATGAPTVAATAGFPLDYPSGDYTLTWDGTGSVAVQYGAMMGAVSTSMSNGVQHNTATVTITQNAGMFAGLTATPPVTNIHLAAPSSMTTGVFMNAFLSRMQPFSTLRFMDPLDTNGSPVKNWSERTWPSEGSRAGTAGGIAYEDIIALANQTHKDVWVNVPALASDDYVCRLARLFKYGEAGDKSDSACDPSAPAGTATTAPLAADVHLYVEYTNEIWNSGFSQWEDIYCMVWGVADGGGGVCHVTSPTSAIAAAELSKTSLPWDTSNKYGKASEFGIVLAKRVSDLFSTVFGAGNTQVRSVFNVQSAYPAEADEAFTFLSTAYGPASSTFYAIAVAPYFNIDGDSNAGSVDDIFTDFQSVLATTPDASNGNAIANWLTADVQFAKKYGVPLVAYEGGQGLSGSTGQDNKIAAQTDPRMYAAYQTYFALWDALVGRKNLFIHYTYVGGAGSYGAWGAMTSQALPGSQKWNALLSLTRLTGDADLDGTVTEADCAIVKASMGASNVFWEQGDFNDDGKVDAADLAALNTSYLGHTCM